jgi:hypothetical protein
MSYYKDTNGNIWMVQIMVVHCGHEKSPVQKITDW